MRRYRRKIRKWNKNKTNKTGLQPVSRPVEQVHYFGGWVEGAKSLWCQGFADRQPYRTGGGSRCVKVGTKVCKTQQTDLRTDISEGDSLTVSALACHAADTGTNPA